jgi:hypothetical protein
MAYERKEGATMARFQTGNTFGRGRPRGSRNKSTVIMEAIGVEGAVELLRRVQRAARQGNLHAAALLLARVWPVKGGRPVAVNLPPIETGRDLIEAHAALIAQMSAGEITIEDASAISRVLERQRRAFEARDLEKRRGVPTSRAISRLNVAGDALSDADTAKPGHDS